MTILEALQDRQLLGSVFADRASWTAWTVFLKATFGLLLAREELEVYRRHTGRTSTPLHPVPREAWVIAGRRAGESRIAALVAVYLATFRDYAGILAPGERGTLPVIAADRRQARTVLRYIVALLEASPMLAGLVARRTAEAIELAHRVTIEVHTASWRAIRGYILIGAVCDEIAFWRDEASANPDTEILAALRPGMATVPGALLLCISSPYARRGALWEAHRRHYAQDGDPVLVWQAPTRAMNPTVPEAEIARAYADDDAAAAAEFGAEFRRDIEAFVAREALEACVVVGRRELPPLPALRYVAFVDPSGGSADSFTLAVAHHDGGRGVLDAVREVRPPFSPEAVVAEFAALLKSYNVSEVVGDRYAGEWPREQFSKLGVRYVVSEKPKSDIYRDALPLLNSGRVELLGGGATVAPGSATRGRRSPAMPSRPTTTRCGRWRTVSKRGRFGGAGNSSGRSSVPGRADARRKTVPAPIPFPAVRPLPLAGSLQKVSGSVLLHSLPPSLGFSWRKLL